MIKRGRKIESYLEFEDAFQERVLCRDKPAVLALFAENEDYLKDCSGLYERIVIDCKFTKEGPVLKWLEFVYNHRGPRCTVGFPYGHAARQGWWKVFLWLVEHVPIHNAQSKDPYFMYKFQAGVPFPEHVELALRKLNR